MGIVETLILIGVVGYVLVTLIKIHDDRGN
jgi:hypothetical protein